MSRRFDVTQSDIRDLVLDECARVSETGNLLVIPTDTVYGIAADAFSASAVSALLAAKGRGRDMPPPVLVPRAETVFGLVDGVDEKLLALTARFWPGPLTIIANAQPSLDWDLGDTHGTVAVRMPDDEYALALLGRTGPLAVSSANVSGSPAATSADEAMEMLGDDVDIYVDGGVRESGISSTIVDLTGDVPKIVREGPVTSDELREIVPDLLDLDG
ncbi:MAG: L-threonylcarbamoyladenylate synthase [Brevibacterium aurantiacum]|uniref:L-threonylcarbamoyladenylate synthase n=1 Tax=Brevibacterium aurantiacum TaxID=273384 RepID=A0A1D7W335_BREAU|nr:MULTISPECIES: L-threonylcarbamoyladenylate synthase [Brevibacterium]MDN5550338.1 threonylcarbamoyl-AMP synthase [Brevibacterium sp.]AOP53463.1 TsaC protein (YrdC domain) required for threonylcarbamoyladenosine t(6)A37 modification in tRNA [Brevibacterium aurantiacum]AZL05658.1 threonylcarbamoyl-AMP synthase [Brevibacterium aurantiacum]AZL09246.1 threonylcarbamoyl-AMP synthase [Brevibacterium aurantiacum]AZL12871.1 threonylcarbamoyl-AMP synthase [Brevibacterium aurantiacum]